MDALATICILTLYPWGDLLAPANIPNWALAVVGILGIGVATCTLFKIERQTKAAQTAVEAALRQADVMKQQMDMQIAKERAILQVEAMGIPALAPVDLPLAPYDVVTYKVFNRGLVAARIGYAYAVVDIAESPDQYTGEGSTVNDANFGTNRDFLFPVTADGVTRYAVSEVRFPWEDINNRKKFVHFYGVIKYHDLLSDQDRETAFHYVWWIDSQRLADGSIFGRWVERGDKNGNCQT
jgi:hypothetical protein